MWTGAPCDNAHDNVDYSTCLIAGYPFAVLMSVLVLVLGSTAHLLLNLQRIPYTFRDMAISRSKKITQSVAFLLQNGGALWDMELVHRDICAAGLFINLCHLNAGQWWKIRIHVSLQSIHLNRWKKVDNPKYHRVYISKIGNRFKVAFGWILMLTINIHITFYI